MESRREKVGVEFRAGRALVTRGQIGGLEGLEPRDLRSGSNVKSAEWANAASTMTVVAPCAVARRRREEREKVKGTARERKEKTKQNESREEITGILV